MSTSSTIGVGGGTGDFNLDDSEITKLADGFSAITIGDAANGTGAVDIDSSTFLDPVTIVGGATGGDEFIRVTGLVSTTNDVTIQARTGNIVVDEPGVTTTTGNITLTSTAGHVRAPSFSNATAELITAGGAININTATGLFDSTQNNGFDIDSSGGAVNLTRTGTGLFDVDYEPADAADVTLTLTDSGSGDARFTTDATGILTLNGFNTANGSITVGSAGSIVGPVSMTAGGGGNIALTATGSVTTNDDITTTGSGTIDVTAGTTATTGTPTSANVLLDINADNTSRNATAAHFEEGIELPTGALAGESVLFLQAGDDPADPFNATVSNVTVNATEANAADNWFAEQNQLIEDGLFHTNGTQTLTFSGAGLGLVANTTYDLHVFSGRSTDVGGNDTSTTRRTPRVD